MASRYTIFSLDDKTVKKLNEITRKVKLGKRNNRSFAVRALIDYCSDPKITALVAKKAKEIAELELAKA